MKRLILSCAFLVLTSSLLFSQTWVQTLNGISMWSLCRDLQGNVYAGTSGTVKAIYKTTNGGDNWNAILSSGVTNFLNLAVDSSGNIYAANVSNGLVISTNGGTNWTTIPVSTFNGKSVQSVVCGKNGYIYVGCVSGGVYLSTNYGGTFSVNNISTSSIVTLTVDRYNSNKIYAGASSTSAGGLYISTDAGLNFSGPYNTFNVWGISQISQNELYQITTTTGYPFSKSTDSGYNWSTISTQPSAMRGLAADYLGNMYLCGNSGVFKTTNFGVTFVNLGLTFSGNQILVSGNKIYAAMSGTSNGGIWICTDSTLVSISPEGTITPTSLYLYQNYPNPFNPTTKIKFDINAAEITTLKIYDALGREAATLVNSYLVPGTYEVNWNATNFAGGIYFYKLESGNLSQTKKLILVK